MRTFLTFFLQKLEALCFPYRCVLCFQRSDLERDLCRDCQARLPGCGMGCKQCADPLFITPFSKLAATREFEGGSERKTAAYREVCEDLSTEPTRKLPDAVAFRKRSIESEQTNRLCGRCIKTPPFYDKILPLYAYEAPVIQMIYRLKFNKVLLYARLLGELMAERLFSHYQQQPLPQCIIPVPLYLTRLRERGFNQALEIARPVAKKLSIPLESSVFQRVRPTLQQAGVMLVQREKNVRHAFAKVGVKNYERVAILDDVVTTGSTVNALSQCLKESGVREVVVWCCARTIPKAFQVLARKTRVEERSLYRNK